MTINRMAYVNIGKVGGAATGTAGSAGTGVLTVQGIASMTPILANPGTIATWGLAALGGATAPTNAQSVAGEYLSSPPTYTNGQAGALQMTAAGSLHTTVDNTNANGSAVSASSSPVVIASDQAAVAVKAASAAFASGSLLRPRFRFDCLRRDGEHPDRHWHQGGGHGGGELVARRRRLQLHAPGADQRPADRAAGR